MLNDGHLGGWEKSWRKPTGLTGDIDLLVVVALDGILNPLARVAFLMKLIIHLNSAKGYERFKRFMTSRVNSPRFSDLADFKFSRNADFMDFTENTN